MILFIKNLTLINKWFYLWKLLVFIEFKFINEIYV